MELTARCISGHTEVLTHKQIEEARKLGVPICSICGSPMILKKASSIVGKEIPQPDEEDL